MLASYIGGGGDEWTVLGEYHSFAFRREHWRPLAPAPSPGGLWAALKRLGERLDDYSRIIKMERGDIVLIQDRPPFWRPYSHIDTAEDTAAILRDGNNFRTLLAYCAQPGWEVA